MRYSVITILASVLAGSALGAPSGEKTPQNDLVDELVMLTRI